MQLAERGPDPLAQVAHQHAAPVVTVLGRHQHQIGLLAELCFQLLGLGECQGHVMIGRIRGCEEGAQDGADAAGSHNLKVGKSVQTLLTPRGRYNSVMPPRTLRVLALLALFVSLARSTTADRLDTAFEKAIGGYLAREFAAPFGTETDPLLSRYVSRLGADVAGRSYRADITCRFVIVGSDTANAFTLPGGYIMVTRGLLDSVDSDDELATILAHEVGHVAKRHATEQIGFNVGFTVLRRLLPQKTLGRNGDTLLGVYSILRTLNKSKEQETQADEEGIKFAYAAGYDPGGLVQFFDGQRGYRNRIEEYFATHPSPEKRIGAAKKSPLVTRTLSAEREHIADGYARRGLNGLAEVARRGGDTLALPPLPPPVPLPDYYRDERASLDKTAEGEATALRKFYTVSRAAGIAQQLLLLNTQLNDFRWIYISGRAYAVQGRISDAYARSARTLRTAPGTWDELARQNLTSVPGSEGAVNGALGRSETVHALDLLCGVATPLSHAQSATAAVLFDLNNRFVRADNTTTWVRYGALEGALRYAESELDRADVRSGKAWQTLSVARIRRYENRLNELVPETDTERRRIWADLLQRRLGAAFPTAGETGTATVRAMVAVSLGASATEVYARRGKYDLDADWVLKTEGVQPENIATALRLATLELERELGALALSPPNTQRVPGVRGLGRDQLPPPNQMVVQKALGRAADGEARAQQVEQFLPREPLEVDAAVVVPFFLGVP